MLHNARCGFPLCQQISPGRIYHAVAVGFTAIFMGAGLVGGLGMAPGANIGGECAIFEAVHGSAVTNETLRHAEGQRYIVGLMERRMQHGHKINKES